MASHNDLGNEGEELAAAYLQKNGYHIITRNYTYLKGEIDIIARSGNIIAIVEVKTRSTPDFGDPQEFLKPAQRKRLVETAHKFTEDYGDENIEVRFDFIGVIINRAGTKIEHLVDAFYHF